MQERLSSRATATNLASMNGRHEHPTCSRAARLGRCLRKAGHAATAGDVIVMVCLAAASAATLAMFGACLRAPTFEVPATFISDCDPNAPAAVWDTHESHRTLVGGDLKSCTQGDMGPGKVADTDINQGGPSPSH